MSSALTKRVERIEQLRPAEPIAITLRTFAGGDLVGYSGSGATVLRLAGESDGELHDRALKQIGRAGWGGTVMRELRA